MRNTFLLLTLSILSFVSQAVAQVQSYDVLGVAMYCNRFLAAPKLPGMSTLLNTFGDPIPCINKRIAQGGLELLQVDLIDATCWRNNKCPPGVPRPDDLKTIKKRAATIRPIKLAHPEIEVWLSPALEHDVKSPATVSKMLDAAQAGCPECRVINSPFSGARPPGTKLELHGTKVSAFSVSGDGASIFDGDNIQSDGNKFEHRVSGSDQTHAWWNELNCRCTGEKNFTPPKLRTERPTAAQFIQAYMNMQPEPPRTVAPGLCKTVREIKRPEITKPNAESYCNGQQTDVRGNKPLLIIKKHGQKGDRLPVFNSAGKKVASFCYYGKFEDPTLGRWYMGDCSGQNPVELYNLLGSEWGYVNLGGGACLRFNAVRRQGVYR